MLSLATYLELSALDAHPPATVTHLSHASLIVIGFDRNKPDKLAELSQPLTADYVYDTSDLVGLVLTQDTSHLFTPTVNTRVRFK